MASRPKAEVAGCILSTSNRRVEVQMLPLTVPRLWGQDSLTIMVSRQESCKNLRLYFSMGKSDPRVGVCNNEDRSQKP